jgi:hypothetical protein
VSSSIDIGISPSGYAKYRDLTQFTDDYIRIINNGLYENVKAAVSIEDTAYALGQSPYAEGHYISGNGPKGSSLLWVIDKFDLKKYDGMQVAKTYPLSVDIEGLRSEISSMPDEQKQWYAAIGFAVVGAYLLLK